jgi:hypothetical protein
MHATINFHLFYRIKRQFTNNTVNHFRNVIYCLGRVINFTNSTAAPYYFATFAINKVNN